MGRDEVFNISEKTAGFDGMKSSSGNCCNDQEIPVPDTSTNSSNLDEIALLDVGLDRREMKGSVEKTINKMHSKTGAMGESLVHQVDGIVPVCGVPRNSTISILPDDSKVPIHNILGTSVSSIHRTSIDLPKLQQNQT